jgi:hypothetical protein
VHASAEIERGFLAFITDLVLCSRCFRRGVRTPVLQPISPRHRVRTLCCHCSARALRRRDTQSVTPLSFST